ncbi:transketolase [bacterium]|nr:transketolase [bacterium]
MRKTALNCVYDLAKTNPRIVFIGSDLGPGVLDEMKTNMPANFYMEGVSEQHIIGMSAGLAVEGFIPYVNTIATFLTRRCFEQIAMDLCLHNLPVRLIANGGGLVYAPLGPTHLATEDFAILKALPNMTIMAPCDAQEMKELMKCTVDWPHPIYIRLGKGGDKIISNLKHEFKIGKAIILKKPEQGLFISTGVMSQLTMQACEILKGEGIICGVMHMHTIKPLDEASLKIWIPKVKAVVSVEEHFRTGGMGSSILEFLNDKMHNKLVNFSRIGIPDQFTQNYGSQKSLLNEVNITPESIAREMKLRLKEINV